MKNTFLILAVFLLGSGCKKPVVAPEPLVPAQEEIAEDVLIYIAGEMPVALNGFGQIYKHENKSETLLTKGAHLYSCCAANSDGTKIVCLRAFNNNIQKTELVVMNCDGTHETVIVPFINSFQFTNMNSPQWATNDKIILIASGRIAIVKSDGGGARFLSKVLYSGPAASAFDIFSPCLSPDGNKIAYVRRPIGDSVMATIDNITQKLPVNTELYVSNITTELDSLYNERRLTNNGYDLRELYPAWSPDGKRLVYCQAPRHHNNSKIYSCDVNGNGLKLLLNNGNDNAFTKWSSDGKRIYYQSYHFTSFNGSIYSCDATDGYGEKVVLKGNTEKQYKMFSTLKSLSK